ncbi:T9SS sorting signal type C domain-containing protein [Flavobacterium sp. RHBU_3]|uniref:T9SS sorting signal type C domain-containing protein n=1 Tax=Flavobacterium sp. RHBU_3 TaxID=3391184 RepID=UPI0039852D7C
MMKLLPKFTGKIIKTLVCIVTIMISINANAQCTAPGDQVTYGQNQWTGYIYSNGGYFSSPPASVSAFTYRGYNTQVESFDFNPGTTAISGTNICGTYADYYTIRFKMNKTYAAGYYSITVGADDGYRLSLDGGSTWTTSLSDWTLHGYTTKTATVYLSGSSNLVYEYFEATGSSRVSFSITSLSCDSTAPTSIAGTTALDCATTSTTLTATGGFAGVGATYQWGTGSVAGQNIISGQTAASITVAPAVTTSYWVRRVNATPCSGYTAAATATVTVTGRGTDPSAFGANTWNVYSYNGGNLDVTTLPYMGSYTQSGVSLNTLNSWGSSVSPSSATGYQGCTVPADYFTFVAKRKGFPCGNYVLTMAQWDDEAIVYVDGVQVWYSATWGGQGTNSAVGSFSLNENSTVEVRVREITGSANAVLNFVTSVPPTSITGVTSLGCGVTSTTLTAAGGTINGTAAYQWGTGAVAGQNILSGQSAATLTVSPTATTTYWVRLINYTNCTPISDAVYTTVTYTPVPGDPSVFGDNSWNVYGYNGSSMSLSSVTYLGYYTQNTLGFDTTAAWGTALSPSSATNWQGCTIPNDYFTYVYKRKGFPCGKYTLKMTSWDDEVAVYVNGTQVWFGYYGGSNYTIGVYDLDQNSTIEVRSRDAYSAAYSVLNIAPATVAPTSISGNLILNCSTLSTTLTATGGSIAGTAVYQWGTGSVAGENIISGQTGASITVAPASTTSYWVRIANFNTCTAYSAAATATVVATATPGNPSEFGSNQWNAYAYSGTSLTLSGANYLGYYTQNTLGFDTMTGTNSWADTLSPSAAIGYLGCPVPNDNFVLVYKRKGFDCGSYQISFTRWDDDAELYIDGTKVWSKTAWSGTALVNDIAGTYQLGANSTIEFRVHENYGSSHATMIVTPLGISSTAPVAITGPSATQCGGSATLVATGGVLGTNAVYEWGTGTVGANIIAGATSATITVAPQQTTTYWVRIKNTTCSTYTAAVTFTVNAAVTVPGVLTSAVTSVCKNSMPAAITLTGYVGNIIKWQSANDAAFTQGVVDIASTNAVLTPAEIGMISTTKYFRAIVQNGTCVASATPALQLNVPAPVIWNGAWSSTPTAATAIEVQADLALDADLSVCSCQVKNTAVFTVNSGVNLTVKGKVTVDATARMILQNKASLLQTDEVANEGNVEVHRNSSKLKRLDYTIWSSPVDNQQLLAFSPNTITTRFYEYNTQESYYQSVIVENNFETAKGYLIRVPNNHSTTTPTVFEGIFTGTPHNGTITKALAYDAAWKNFNAIGNPYPSPISINAFIDANIDNMEGTLWIWRKTNNATQSSYSILTKFAYVANTAPGGENEYAVNPNGYLNTAQGFIVKAKNGGNVVFTNSMRYGNSSNQFFKSAQTVQASKYYLNVTDVNGSFTQAAIGYTSEATLNYDNGLDGKSIVDNSINIYSIQGENNLAIQARPEFNSLDIVPIGIKANIAGTFSISLTDTDGIFADEQQPVFVWDTTEGIVFNLKNGAYTFSTETGVYNERFKVIYSAQALGTDAPQLTQNSVIIYGTNGELKVVSDEPIQSVAAYDILGRELLSKANVNNTTFNANVSASQQVVIVKVMLENGRTSEKKIIMK